MTRKRSAIGEMVERAWWRDHQALHARDAARIPPSPDPVSEPREFVAWMRKHAQSELTSEWIQLFDDMWQLPSLKYRRARECEIGSWILWLLACQGWGAPYDLRTCKLGANPANPNARSSQMLRYLTATVARQYPKVERCRLYDAIRNWRKTRAKMDASRSGNPR